MPLWRQERETMMSEFVLIMGGYFACGFAYAGVSFLAYGYVRRAAREQFVKWLVICAWMWPILASFTVWDESVGRWVRRGK